MLKKLERVAALLLLFVGGLAQALPDPYTNAIGAAYYCNSRVEGGHAANVIFDRSEFGQRYSAHASGPSIGAGVNAYEADLRGGPAFFGEAEASLLDYLHVEGSGWGSISFQMGLHD